MSVLILVGISLGIFIWADLRDEQKNREYLQSLDDELFDEDYHI